MRHLRQRNQDEKAQGRQDLADIPALVDVNATMALARSRKRNTSKKHSDKDAMCIDSALTEASTNMQIKHDEGDANQAILRTSTFVYLVN